MPIFAFFKDLISPQSSSPQSPLATCEDTLAHPSMFSVAFFNAPSLPRTPQNSQRSILTCSRDTLILVPDHLSQRTPPWYKNLQAQLPDVYVHLLQMPNPYGSNTKRWESVWLQVMRDATRLAIGQVSLLGHGTGADASMRFLESHSVESGVVLLAPSGDEYYAGERHGRPYHWDLIRANVGAGLVLAISPTLERAENRSLVENLQPTLVHDISKELGRHTELEEPGEIAKFVRCANAMKIS